MNVLAAGRKSSHAQVKVCDFFMLMQSLQGTKDDGWIRC